tara:strand:+ start:293 stop:502 length:210 start_codon:yes stop_codon:yes gene_type:complete
LFFIFIFLEQGTGITHKAQAEEKRKGGTRPQARRVTMCRGATLCYIDKIFLDRGPCFRNRGARLTVNYF